MLELLLGGNELVMRGGCQLGRWCLPILKVVLAGKPDLKETESLRALLLAHASMDVKYAHERTHKHAACIHTRAHTQTDTHTMGTHAGSAGRRQRLRHPTSPASL